METIAHPPPRIHPAANIFPMMDEEAFRELKADIEKNGQREPVVFWQNQLIDGRNRWRACEELGVDCEHCELEEDQDPVSYVLSANLHRRHLTPSQCAMIGARAREMYDKAAKERQKRKPADSVPENLPEQKADARDAVGKVVGVSGKSIDHASKVLKDGSPDLIQAVESGKVKVSKAAQIVKNVSHEKQVWSAIEPGKRPKAHHTARVVSILYATASAIKSYDVEKGAPTPEDVELIERHIASLSRALARLRRTVRKYRDLQANREAAHKIGLGPTEAVQAAIGGGE